MAVLYWTGDARRVRTSAQHVAVCIPEQPPRLRPRYAQVMQAEHAIPSADIVLLPVSGSASRGYPSPDVATNRNGDRDTGERWRQWCARGAKADQGTARLTTGGFVVIFVALCEWLVFQLLR